VITNGLHFWLVVVLEEADLYLRKVEKKLEVY
jgi:phosphoribosyl-ATP pyrophosphohydrolase